MARKKKRESNFSKVFSVLLGIWGVGLIFAFLFVIMELILKGIVQFFARKSVKIAFMIVVFAFCGWIAWRLIQYVIKTYNLAKEDTRRQEEENTMSQGVLRGDCKTKHLHYSEEQLCQIAKMVFPSRQPSAYDQFAKYGGEEAEMLSIDLMEGHEFEYWCASALKNDGFSSVDVTKASGDQGVDIVASKDGIRYAIQCKRYGTNLGNTPVQEVHAGKKIYRCHVGVVITNQYFTQSAKELAESTGTLLWDREWIRKHLNNTGWQVPTEDEVLDGDEFLPQAIDIVVETGEASVSILQRKLKLGYARSARIIDEMEEKGIVGPFQGSQAREIYLDAEAWEKIKTMPR